MTTSLKYNEFAARVDWCLTDDETKVNHAPTVTVKQGIDIEAKAGDTVTLTAEGKDQDDNTLTYHWWRYFESDTYQDSPITTKDEVNEIGGMQIDITRQVGEDEKLDTIEINNSDEAEMSFVVPEDAKSGDTIHMIVEVQDNGKHELKHYQRVIITVK